MKRRTRVAVAKPVLNRINRLCCCKTGCATAIGSGLQWQRCRNTGCAGALQAVPLQHRLCRCSRCAALPQHGFAAATRAVPLQHGLRCCITGCGDATQAQSGCDPTLQATILQHGLCRRCNTGRAAAAALQHRLCLCNTGFAAATRAAPLQHRLCHCLTGSVRL